MLKKVAFSAAVTCGLALAGCADGGLGGLTTASIDPATAVVAKADPACAPLSQQINSLRAEGIADKVTKAAAKKYKMTPADLAKADQLNKANADFQTKCSTVPPQQTAAAAAPAAAAAKTAEAATAKTADAVTAKAVNLGAAKAAQ